MNSRLLEPAARAEVERALLERLQSEPERMSLRTAGSPRAVGDALDHRVADLLQEVLSGRCSGYARAVSRRAMEDVSFQDLDGYHYAVDVKTHRSGTAFNMPNLTSVERLARFYEKDENFFCLLLVRYLVSDWEVLVSEVIFAPLEAVDWECLTLGALGQGQVQLRNASRILLRTEVDRQKWMLEFCDRVLRFYPAEKAKIERRIQKFEKLREHWAARTAPEAP